MKSTGSFFTIKKLNKKEIDQTVIKLKNKYHDFMKKYGKSGALLDAFDNRYLNALKSKINLEIFLKAELDALDELEKREIEKRIPVNKPKPAPTIADKVMEENRKKILKYNCIKFHADAIEELQYLLGALNELDSYYIPMLFNIFRGAAVKGMHELLSNISNEMRFFGEIKSKGISARFEKYYTLLNTFPRDYNSIDNEERLILKETGFLLNNIESELRELTNSNKIPEPEKIIPLNEKGLQVDKNNLTFELFQGKTRIQVMKIVHNFIKQVINDFRIKDFKKTR